VCVKKSLWLRLQYFFSLLLLVHYTLLHAFAPLQDDFLLLQRTLTPLLVHLTSVKHETRQKSHEFTPELSIYILR